MDDDILMHGRYSYPADQVQNKTAGPKCNRPITSRNADKCSNGKNPLLLFIIVIHPKHPEKQPLIHNPPPPPTIHAHRIIRSDANAQALATLFASISPSGPRLALAPLGLNNQPRRATIVIFRRHELQLRPTPSYRIAIAYFVRLEDRRGHEERGEAGDADGQAG